MLTKVTCTSTLAANSASCGEPVSALEGSLSCSCLASEINSPTHGLLHSLMHITNDTDETWPVFLSECCSNLYQYILHFYTSSYVARAFSQAQIYEWGMNSFIPRLSSSIVPSHLHPQVKKDWSSNFSVRDVCPMNVYSLLVPRCSALKYSAALLILQLLRNKLRWWDSLQGNNVTSWLSC